MQRYEEHARRLRILPGQWRPHYPWEQIAWISPSWPSQDYLWLDFPEAIFTDQGLLFLSHVNPDYPAQSDEKLTLMPWRMELDGIAYERRLPNGVRFGGKVRRFDETTAALTLFIDNQSEQGLTNITLQTCLYLRGCREFADYSQENKLLHRPGEGWMSFPEASRKEPLDEGYGLGWRGGPLLTDRPMAACRSSQGQRYVIMSWYGHTRSLVGNPFYPCMHADPAFPDLAKGQMDKIHGYVAFFEGELKDFSPPKQRELADFADAP